MSVVSSNMIKQVKRKKLKYWHRVLLPAKPFDVSRICADLVK